MRPIGIDSLINPRHMRRRVTVVVLVCLSVFLSITMKSAAYLVFTSQTKFSSVLYGVFNIFTIWLSLKTFRSRVLAILPVTAAFLAPWRAFDGQTRQRRLLSTRKVYLIGYRSKNTTGLSLILVTVHWQRSFLATSACLI